MSAHANHDRDADDVPDRGEERAEPEALGHHLPDLSPEDEEDERHDDRHGEHQRQADRHEPAFHKGRCSLTSQTTFIVLMTETIPFELARA